MACACATGDCPFVSLRSALAACTTSGARSSEMMEVAEQVFPCKACQADGRCRGVVGPTKGGVTGLTVLSKNAFSGNYAAGSVALCGTTKDKWLDGMGPWVINVPAV